MEVQREAYLDLLASVSDEHHALTTHISSLAWRAIDILLYCGSDDLIEGERQSFSARQ
jgi:hypothetical protein